MDEMVKSDLFLSVIRLNKGIIYKIANSYSKTNDDRQDLVQEIIIQLWRSFDNYDQQYKHSTWIYRIALNVAISYYRKENTRKKISHPLAESIFNFTEDDSTHEKETDLGILQTMISELKDLDKALMLLYLEEKSHKEIAQIIGISESNVATKINRIKNSFKQKFAQIKQS